MTKRRTAERAVIDAAMAWFHAEPGGPTRLMRECAALSALDLEPATAVRTTAIPLATSADAAAYMSKHVHRVTGLVFGTILQGFRAGAFGHTTDAIEQRLKRSHQSVSPRVTDLRDCGWIEDSGFKRETRYGQQAIVWKPTEAALVAVTQIEEWSW